MTTGQLHGQHGGQDTTNDSEISIRQIASALQLPRMTVWRTLHQHDLHPYHHQKVQVLTHLDYLPRMQFCRWLLRSYAANHRFLSLVLCTDEATFGRDGTINLHNRHTWSRDNTHVVVRRAHQVRFSINVWAGIIGDYLIRPYLLPQRLDGAT